jgi:hypothetical protein
MRQVFKYFLMNHLLIVSSYTGILHLISSDFKLHSTLLDDVCVDHQGARLLPNMRGNLEFLCLSNTGLSEQIEHFHIFKNR